jgi:hypothetical protein
MGQHKVIKPCRNIPKTNLRLLLRQWFPCPHRPSKGSEHVLQALKTTEVQFTSIPPTKVSNGERARQREREATEVKTQVRTQKGREIT